MIQIENKRLNEIPTLCLHKIQTETASTKHPVVIMLHGLTNQKEDNLTYAYLLAEKGFYVFLPDALHHGDRKNGINYNEQSFKLWETILNSIHELDKLKVDITKGFNIDPSRIYLGGISMGAITTFGALTQYDWIKGAFCMMGDPAFVNQSRRIYFSLEDGVKSKIESLELYEKKLAPYDLSLQPKKLNGRPLFVWHGDADTTVPISSVQNFVEKFRLAGYPGEITMKVQKGRGHKVSNFGYHAMIEWLCLQENNFIHSPKTHK